MRLDMECMRDVMLTVEDADFDERLNLDWLEEKLPNYSFEVLWYTCLKLEEGELLGLETVQLGSPWPDIKSITGLTYKGHELLANIHSSNVWGKTKNILSKIGVKSTAAIAQIAANVVTELIKIELGLK